MRVGVFDSGVGGLSVWGEIVRLEPDVPILYVADQAHVPYGSKNTAQVLDFAHGITRFLASNDCKIIVLACNTASAAALQALRHEWPDLDFVGMEPAIKPAAARSRRKVIAVLGTQTTLQGELFEHTLTLHASATQIVRQACPGLVELIEAGETGGEKIDTMLRSFLVEARQQHADTIVLACTHYPFVRDNIARLVGPEVEIIDPSPAVARRVQQLLLAKNATHGTDPAATPYAFYTTGPLAAFNQVATQLVRRTIRARAASWHNGALLQAPEP